MWTSVGKISDIAEGQSRIFSVEGKEIAVFNSKGNFHALDNRCPHRGGPLGEGYLDGAEVTCPWHAWTFDVTTGKCATEPSTKQKTFKTKIENGEIFVETD